MKRKKELTITQKSRQKQLCRRLDWVTLLLGIIIIIAAMGTINVQYDLSKSNPQGFVMWFLLIIGWIPLELFGLIRWLFGFQEEFAVAGEGPTLGICALTSLVAAWVVIRFYVARFCRPEVLKIAFHFILIFACWGVFQLFCYLAALGCERSDIGPLNKNLRRQQQNK